MDALRLEGGVVDRVVARVQIAGDRVPTEIVGIRVSLRAQRRQLGAPLGDDLVLVLRRLRAARRASGFLPRHRYTPCFRLAAMKSSRSPSSTACVLPTS